MLSFDYRPSPARVLFGRGVRDRAAEVLRDLGCERALVLTTPPQQKAGERLATDLGKLCLGVYARAVMHTPVEVTEAAVEVVRDQRADCLVSLGGGSTVGLGKAIVWRTGLAHVAIPTTYAGSEVTPLLGQTEGGRKTTFRDPKVYPTAVLYDPDLTESLPPGLSVTSGMNALAHAVEALYAPDATPIATLTAAEGIRALVAALPGIAGHPTAEDRERALYGAWLCGSVLGQVTMGLHHRICHGLGGAFDLPHAETHTVVLPHVAAYNAGPALAPLWDALGPDTLAGFAARLNAPTALRDLGMPEAGIARIAAEIAARAPANPRPLDRAALEALLRAAWAGTPPQTDKKDPTGGTP